MSDKLDMRKIFLSLFLSLTVVAVFAQTKPLYRLPDNPPEKASDDYSMPFLVGTDSGLFQIKNGSYTELWGSGKVLKILRTTPTDGAGNPSVKWYLLTNKGIYSSTDLKTFTSCNNGLPELTLKEYDNGQKKLVKQTPLLKGLGVDPMDQNTLITATKDGVYLTRDGGKSWRSLGSMSDTAGIKTVGVAHMPTYSSSGEITGSSLVAFMSHSINGFAYCFADSTKPKWNTISSGFAILPSLPHIDEVGDIVPILCEENGTSYVEIYCSQTYLPKIYRLNWKTKRAEVVYSGKAAVETNDGFCQVNDSLFYATMGEIKGIKLDGSAWVRLPERYSSWKKQLFTVPGLVNAAFVPPKTTDLAQPLQLSELWLLTPDKTTSPYDEMISNKKALYTSTNSFSAALGETGYAKYRKLLKDNNLNALVVEMKNDDGVLKFKPNSSLLKQKGYSSAYGIDVEKFVKTFKEDGIYLIARVVVFKDKNLADYAGSKYAAWNYSTGRPWVGVNSYNADGTVSYTGERWVDPYCEEVWEYNVAVANELIERGFDEIQFDYIRFPTDGINVGSASYRWKDTGMDKESALMSFLAYARKYVKGPIGIDIYGANGWYRSGTRTGQDVEMLSQYVDVICPMFYPSHFEQNFLESSPVIERPYRIYFYGTYRNQVIGRNRIVVRPWVQTFYLNVRYDVKWYDKDYVRREIYGVRDATNNGYMHWNNAGNYATLSPDPDPNTKSPWHADESDLQPLLPAFSSPESLREENKSLMNLSKPKDPTEGFADMISIWDSVLYPSTDSEATKESLGASAKTAVKNVFAATGN